MMGSRAGGVRGSCSVTFCGAGAALRDPWQPSWNYMGPSLPCWQLLPSLILVRSPFPEVIGIPGTPQYKEGGVRSSEMKVIGQVWHRCEPGGHSICQAVPAAAQGWKLVSVHPEGETGGTGVCLAVTHATGSGPSWGIVLSLTSPEMRRLPRTLVTDLHSHTVHAALSCGHCKILATPN